MRGKGRHDPCVLPRAAPMVEVSAAVSRSESKYTVDRFLKRALFVSRRLN